MNQNLINKIIMQEIGLGVDNYQKIIDQDTRETLLFKEKNMKYSSQNNVLIGRNDMIFDPINNRFLMMSLFDHFATKIEEEDGKYISIYYDVNGENGSALEAVVDGEKITSDYYNNDSLKYLDIIMQLNDAENISLKQYDKEIPQDKGKKKTR